MLAKSMAGPGAPSATEKEWERRFSTAMAALPSVVPSTTIVMEASAYLIRQGLFVIPDVGTENRKQVLAFLHISSWLQQYMIDRWVDAGELPPSARANPEASPDFELVLIGPGGTGKPPC